MKEAVLVVDDEPSIRVALERLLGGRGYEVETAGSGEEALARLRRCAFDLVVTDLTLTPMSGMDLLVRLREEATPPAVVMITAYGSEKMAVEAMKRGAVDYLPKPFDNEELVLVVERALAERRLQRDFEALSAEVHERYRFHNILGRSAAMQAVFSRIEKVAPTDLTVLIRGPSGTGKELVAHAIHYNSPRRRRPLVMVNCAAFSRELVESELFGHEQGAFTGATKSRPGKFELADGGSLFLDEIGDMSLETQAKVLRVLQEKSFERVGGQRTLHVDIRLLAATNQDLEQLILAGRFREDLYYRLNVVEVELPSLVERREDLPLLAEHFRAQASQRLQRSEKRLSAAALRALTEHSWPGNVRELRHAIEHAVALADGDEIDVGDLPATLGRRARETEVSVTTSHNFKEAKRELVERFERRFLTAALERHGGNVTRAAEEMGMYRQHLQMKMAKLGLDPGAFRQVEE